MLLFDASNMKFRNAKIRDRNPDCIVCGEKPSLIDVSTFDYEDFCQTKCSRYDSIFIPPENNITVHDFEPIYQEHIKSSASDKVVLIDVRAPV
jgi:adenylyltransferase/sulfurtransferase